MSPRIFILLLLVASAQLMAREVESVTFADTVSIGQQQLVLNGVGVRTKFFVKVYACALYLPQKDSTASHIVSGDEANRIVMHFLHSRVEKDKIVNAWNEGFSANLSNKQLASLQSQINQFNAFSQDMRKGDIMQLDYIPASGTEVKINGILKGVVIGREFNNALQSIWLGSKPVTDELKNALLGK